MKNYLLESKNPQRASYLWNMTGSMLFAFQSVILLMVLTRVLDLVYSGIFAIANANAGMLLIIGKYGVRNFQASDVSFEYSFKDFHRARIMSIIAMLAVSVGYTCYGFFLAGYSGEKALIILWMCILRVPDAYEDVFFAEYQRRNRLDVGAKAQTLRLIMTIVFLAVTVSITKNLLLSLIITTLFTTLLLLFFISVTRIMITEGVKSADFSRIKSLMLACFPIFAATFLSFYIGNAPKYAIDSQLSDDIQAIYGFISMPVFVIGLLNGFIFNPIIYKLSCMWEEKKYRKFSKNIIRQIFIVIGITVVCIVGAYLIGIPVLSFIYNTDLSGYKNELLLLLVGGGFLGASGVYMTALTIMRHQKLIMYVYAIVSLGALVTSSIVVRNYGIMGAVVLYDVLMGGICILFIGVIVAVMKKAKAKYDESILIN